MKQQKLSMFRTASVIAILLGIAGCGSSSPTTTSQVNTAPDIQGAGTEQQVVRLGLPVTQLEMNHREMEPVFEVRDVPSICTRTVQRGSRTECHTENRQQCRNVPFPVCTTHSENVCRNVPDQVCHTQQVPVCQNVPRQVCETVQKCETVNDRVCRGVPPNQTCTNVPRRVCHAEQSCRTQNQQVCHNESRRVCENITRRECHVETRQQCHNENRQECTNIPEQICQQIPIIVQEQYSCMKQEQVQVGERLRLHQFARIRIDLINPRNLDVSRDELVVTLNQGMVSAVARSASGIQYQIRETAHRNQRVSATEELIEVTLEVVAL